MDDNGYDGNNNKTNFEPDKKRARQIVFIKKT